MGEAPWEMLNRQRRLCLVLARELREAVLVYRRLEERIEGKISLASEREFLQMVSEEEFQREVGRLIDGE